MAQDNNFTGNLDLLSANPRVGRGRVPATGLPEFEAVLYGYSSAQLLAGVAAPIGCVAITTNGVPYAKTGAGDTAWVPLLDASALGALMPSSTFTGTTTITTPNNVFPQALFTGQELTVPFSGTWLVNMFCTVSRNGAVGGTVLQGSALAQVTVNGVGTGQVGVCRMDTDQASYPLLLQSRLTGLVAGQTIGVNFGFGGAQAGSTLTASSLRTLAMLPTV